MTPLGIHACGAIILLALTAEGKWDFTRLHVGDFKWVGCRVLTVTKDSVMVTNHDNRNKVEIYPFHHRLASGWFNLLASDPFSYCRDDLEVGDQVCLNILKAKGQPDYCVSFGITERPGGAVPPTRRYRVGDFKPHHECVNAYAAERNDKTPIPRHLSFGARAMDYPAFDPHLPRKERLAPWPAKTPFSYIEFALFLR